MAGVNKVILVGNLGNDPDMKYMPSGDAVTSISIATSESWKDKQTGEKREKTEWHRVTLFRGLGKVAGEYLRKGSKVYIEGKLETRKWQAPDGSDRYSTSIIADNMQFLDSRGAGAVQNNGGYAPGQDVASGNNGGYAPRQRPQSALNQPSSSSNDFEDDIPF